MKKILLIIKREYLTRIRKKSFIIMSILSPLLFVGIIFVPAWLAEREEADVKTIAVVEYDQMNKPIPDSLLIFKNVIPNKDKLKFQYIGGIPFKTMEHVLRNSEYYGILVLRYNVLYSGEKSIAQLYSKSTPSMAINVHISKSLEQFIHDTKLLKYNIPMEIINSLKTKVEIETIKLKKEGGFKTERNYELKIALGVLCAFMIYMYIFFSCSQVMRGVIEEKTNRIIEVIITSVKPFQLMAGKITGIGLLGLTQFLIWIILSFSIYQIGSQAFINNQLKTQQNHTPTELFSTPAQSQPTTKLDLIKEIENQSWLSKIREIPFGLMAFGFLFYFVGGYLLYSSMFAAIGSAIDSETDTQQFVIPVTLPLIISLVLMQSAVTNPDGNIAVLFSYIPFTSPVIMMGRLAFIENPLPQLIISLSILLVTALFFTWISARIYRVGILMYGKKASYREMFKWMRYK